MVTRYVNLRPAVLVIDPPTKEFDRATIAQQHGNCDPEDMEILKGGITDEIRHIIPRMAVLVEVIMVCYEDKLVDRSRIAHILRRRFGFFPSAKQLSKAINRVKALRESQLIIPTTHLHKLEVTT